MKSFKVVLCVLLLASAIVSAVFSYLLYERRASLVDSWNKLLDGIYQSTGAMDRNSGTEVAAQFVADLHNHKNPATASEAVPFLIEQAAKLVDTRDQLAQTVADIGKALELETLINIAELQNLEKSAAAQAAALKQIQELKKQYNTIVDGVVTSAKALGMNISAADLKGAKASATIAQFTKKIDELKKQDEAYKKLFADIAITMKNPELAKASTDKIADEVRKMMEKLQSLEAKSGNIGLTANEELKAAREELAKFRADIRRINILLGLEPSDELPPVWADGSIEAKAELIGKVTSVNKEFGFAATDIGTATTVTQKLGEKELQIKANLAVGDEVMIVRNWGDAAGVEFVARAKVSAINEGTSIIEPAKSDIKVKVGDTVIFQPKK